MIRFDSVVLAMRLTDLRESGGADAPSKDYVDTLRDSADANVIVYKKRYSSVGTLYGLYH